MSVGIFKTRVYCIRHEAVRSVHEVRGQCVQSCHCIRSCAQPLAFDAGGSGGLDSLPRNVQKQLRDERKAGGVQHLLDMLHQIEVRAEG